MHGLYVHVPFCVRKCHYCSFVSGEADSGTRRRWFDAMLSELRMAVDQEQPVTTLYAGGGTPSLLQPRQWMTFMDVLQEAAETSCLDESTIEVNPATCQEEDIGGFREAGFDRISIGVQSFGSRELALLGRIHTVEQAENTLRQAADAGYGSIGLDLIYGIPGQTTDDWQHSLDRAISHMPDHISAYDLSLDRGTPFWEKKLEKPADDVCAEMYHQAHMVLTETGYDHYEVSSYSLGERERSIHNTGYWRRTPYTGLGPSAHSFDGRNRRWWNTPDTARYTGLLENGDSPVEDSEILTTEQQVQEILMLGMRWTVGFDCREIATLGAHFSEEGNNLLERLSSEGHVTVKGALILPSETGMLLADGLALEMCRHLEYAPGG